MASKLLPLLFLPYDFCPILLTSSYGISLYSLFHPEVDSYVNIHSVG